MEWNQLEYFKTVAQMGHVTRAAEKLTISQSALSHSIAKLESELGFPLFDRNGKSIRLNQNGRLFLNYVNRALQEISVGRQVVLDSLNPNVGNVSLAFLRSLGTSLVPKLLVKFREQFPQIQFKLYENGTLFLLQQLLSGEIDLCLCPSVLIKNSIEWVPLFSEELFIAVSRRHRLAKQDRVSLHEIANEPIITLKKGYGLRILTDQFFEQIDINPLIVFEGEEIMTLAGLVEAQFGVALIPYLTGLDKLDIVLIPVSTPKCARTIGIAWNKNNYLSRPAKKVKNFIIESFAQDTDQSLY